MIDASAHIHPSAVIEAGLPPMPGVLVVPSTGGMQQHAQHFQSNEFSRRAIEQGVAFVPGAPFYCEQPDPATLRLSFATSDVEKIREGVSRLARALHAA